MTEVGKSAKRIGAEHPRVLRRTEPVPERPTPKARQRKKPKRYGFTYEDTWGFRNGGQWKRRHVWFVTKRARDQALADFRRKAIPLAEWYRDIRAVDSGES